MDISIDKVGVDVSDLSESMAGRPAVSVSPYEDDNYGKASGSDSDGSVSNQQVKALTEEIQGYIDRININIAFSTYGEKNNNVSVIVSEKETGALIREIPPKELQRLHVKMEELTGIIFDERV